MSKGLIIRPKAIHAAIKEGSLCGHCWQPFYGFNTSRNLPTHETEQGYLLCDRRLRRVSPRTFLRWNARPIVLERS
jgi:hypothetical protein